MADVTAPGGERTKVLWLTKGLGPGGAERLLLSFAQRADHDRFDLHAGYLLPWKDHLVGALEDAGVTVHRLDGPRARDARWLSRLRGVVREVGIDIVHDHSPLVAAQARVVLRLLPRSVRPALVTTEHNLWSSHRPLTRVVNRMTLGLEDHVFAVSDQVRDSMSPRRRDRTEVLIHGVDIEAISRRRTERTAARADHGLADDDLVVVTVANLRTNKDYPTMLAAARSLVDDGVPVTFLSVGQGPLEAELARQRDGLGLGNRFRFLGYQADPVRVLAAGDVFCLSSRYEGLPIALLEALAMGLPAVSTDVGGIPHVVRDGQEGLLVPPGEPLALAAALRRTTDIAVRDGLAANAARRSGAFDIRNAVQRQQEVYEQLA